MGTNWRKIIRAALENKTANAELAELAILHTGIMVLLDNAVFPRDAIDIALDEAYAKGLLPPRRPLPIPMSLAYSMRWGDRGFFILSTAFPVRSK